MQVYKGIVHDRVVVLPEGVQLEDGLRVEVRVPGTAQESPEELFKKRLVEEGLIDTVKEPAWPTVDQDRTPIEVEGEPLSEQIIKDRR